MKRKAYNNNCGEFCTLTFDCWFFVHARITILWFKQLEVTLMWEWSRNFTLRQECQIRGNPGLLFSKSNCCCFTSFLYDPYSLQRLMKRWFHAFVSFRTQARLHLWILQFPSQVIQCKQLFKVLEKNWGLLTGCGPYSSLFLRAVSKRGERLYRR